MHKNFTGQLYASHSAIIISHIKFLSTLPVYTKEHQHTVVRYLWQNVKMWLKFTNECQLSAVTTI